MRGAMGFRTNAPLTGNVPPSCFFSFHRSIFCDARTSHVTVLEALLDNDDIIRPRPFPVERCSNFFKLDFFVQLFATARLFLCHWMTLDSAYKTCCRILDKSPPNGDMPSNQNFTFFFVTFSCSRKLIKLCTSKQTSILRHDIFWELLVSGFAAHLKFSII